jgi:small subunit ribosomal protein S17
MSDDETKQETTDETTPVADEDAQSAGPVADEDSSSSQAAGEEPSSAPPAEDAPEADAGEAPAAAEGSADDAPPAEKADEAPAAEASPDDDLPWKERKRLERSRRPHEVRPAASPEDRAAQRLAGRKTKAAERRKERAGAKARKGAAATGTPVAERDANAAKVRQGIVVSNKGDKSITVRIDIARRHPTYEKIVRRSRTLHAHDERNEAGEGDVVRVIETRPLSKTKRWRLVDVVEKAR